MTKTSTRPHSHLHLDDGAASNPTITPDPRGTDMPDKSPQRPAGKKPGKSLKEKRDAKRDKKQGKRPIPA